MNSSFPSLLVAWQKKSGRHDLPWQNTRDPYRVWLSEIMLQQTQVETVKPYYARFLEAFPTVEALAAAPRESVLALWSGLGYYRRASHLHEAAQTVTRLGAFPDTQEGLMTLPGVGRSTAAAIAVFAFGRRAAILDGNVRRVLTRHEGWLDRCAGRDLDEELWQRVEELLPKKDLSAYTQGLMDLGAEVCTRSHPKCGQCPVCDGCAAFRNGETDKLPPSKKPVVLERRFAMLAMRRGDSVLLYERKNETVWAGLWSFPEWETEEGLASGATESLRGEILRRFGLKTLSLASGATVVHKLTHRKLTIDFIEARVEGRVKRGGDEPARFFTVDAALELALPAPVRKYLSKG